MTTKQKLGQFYTTNYKYIFQNLFIPKNVLIIEPFTGQGDLLEYVKEDKRNEVECYDIEPKKDYIIQRDTLMDPPNYNNKFILTNPPFLARNKSKDKNIYDKYKQNDLYKCFIKELTKNKCLGGILITPLNFWCSVRINDINLRKEFLSIYNIITINIFEEQVFNDTTCTICSFQFEIIVLTTPAILTKCQIYPYNKIIDFLLNEKNNYTLGGEIYNLKQNDEYIIERITKNNRDSSYATNILVKCIDDNEEDRIGMSLVDKKDIFVDQTSKSSARSYMTLIIKHKTDDKRITIDIQKKIVDNFNEYLNSMRERYKSLFLSCYREGTRKRISFKLVFEITNYLLNH